MEKKLITINTEMNAENFLQVNCDEVPSFLVPIGYNSRNGELYKITGQKIEDGKVKDEVKIICRQTPFITKVFTNIENNQTFYEVSWFDKGKLCKVHVPYGTLAIRKELLQLAYESLAVNETNVKDLIEYFDKMIAMNNFEVEMLVERLGRIQNVFVHPLNEGIFIKPIAEGEMQLLNAFQTSGTVDEWKENVLDVIKQYPKALLMVLSSFTSVILADLKLQPFILDLSGPTSRGKSTVLNVCASVWGTNNLISEWNTTDVAVERKATFLNSFPVFLDDTRKAKIELLNKIVYLFSGGRTKGRGKLKGVENESTWNNILISTGENPITEYAQQAAGVAARVIPITGIPFDDVNYQFFGSLYDAIENYYGSIGYEFLKKWEEQKNEVISQFKEYVNIFQEKAYENEVVSRIARYYAGIVYTGYLLNQFFNCDLDLQSLIDLFDVITEKNKAVDKPKQLLENILEELDSNRSLIYYENLVTDDLKDVTIKDYKAAYKDKHLLLTIQCVKEALGAEHLSIRDEWLRKGYTIRQKDFDYKNTSLKYLGSPKMIWLSLDILEKLGFNFEISSTK